MKLQKIRLPGVNGEIAGLDYEARRTRGVALVCGHGYSSSKQNLDGLCGFLAGHGFSVISIDFPGHKLGSSSGTMRGIADCVSAMQAAVEYARRTYTQTVYVLGHSMGAMTALRVCAEDAEIRGVISIATGWGRLAALEALQKRGVTDLRSAYVDGATLPEVMAEVEAGNDAMIAGLSDRPKLFIAADRDMMVTVAGVQELYDRASEPKTFATVESDHTFAGDRSRAAVLQWLQTLHPRAAA